MIDGSPSAAGEALGVPEPPDRALGGKRRRQGAVRTLAWAAVAAGALLAWGLASLPLLRSLELKTYDWRFVLSGRENPPPGIILVTVDPRTEAALPEPRVFWQPHFAALLRALAAGGARAVGLDVMFATGVGKWLPDADRDLAAAFAEVSASVPVVLGYSDIQPVQAGLPLYMLASAQDAMGFTNQTLDPDGYVRRQELADRGGAKSFAARLAEACSPGGAAPVTWRNGKLCRGTAPVPLDRGGCMMVHYWGPGGAFPAVSMADVLAAAGKRDTGELARWFRNRIVLIGSLDPDDASPTPFYSFDSQARWGTAGVEIHANTLATLLEGRYLREASPAASLILLAGGACLAGLIVFLIRFPLTPLAFLAGLLLYLAAAVHSQRAGLVLPVVAPVLALLFSGLGSYSIYALTEGRQRRLLQEMFGRYVSREAAKELLEYGDIPLGGTRREITVLFSDLRDYTAYCQGRDPRQVVAELNEHFADMTAAIKANGGMVNKFLGDGIMALFGAPLPVAGHALAAVRCGLEMVSRNDQCNRRRIERGLAPLVVGIGIHTGEAVVGTIGTAEKMEYTAIGSAANLASRIEGQNKEFNSRLLVSEVTYRLVQDRARGELAGAARLKGVSEAVPLYRILELKDGRV